MKKPGKRYTLPGLALLLALAAGAGWLLLPRVQVLRADNLVSQANQDIAAANEALAAFELADISLESFTSIASIQQAGESLSNSLPAIDAATVMIHQAALRVEQAAGLYHLPPGYRDYLEHKQEITELRIEQLERLEETVEELRMLYQDGDVIFTAIEEMDRLWGQVEYSLQTVQSNPANSGASLEQAAEAMRRLRDQVDARYQEHGFVLLDSLSGSIEENAKLADMAVALADAVLAGNQADAQQAASSLQAQLLNTTDTSGLIETWIEQLLKPGVDYFQQLQHEQEELDQQAAELFNSRT